MIVGYVRLSRDDNKKNYMSIENQKLMINQYAKENNFSVDRWYEDDGVSGYTFKRDGLGKLLEDLETDIDIILAKDLSRIGRHNAKVLLLLEEIKEKGKRIILVDDDYDTWNDEDDIIGIKTWYNEQYVKSVSKNIRKTMRARQKAGTLAVNIPFGYIRNPINHRIEINPLGKCCVEKIFELYLNGLGFRTIADKLMEMGLPTPSMMERDRFEKENRSYRKKVSEKWSSTMVGTILKNDFYIGTLRLHKQERIMINGKENKVKKEDQLVFENNHEPIIKREDYELVQKILQSRIKQSYRGQKRYENRYGGSLICSDCRAKLTAINRGNGKKYYICSTYNKFGKKFCNSSHYIREDVLDDALLFYLHQCCVQLADELQYLELEKVGDGTKVEECLEILMDLKVKEEQALQIIMEQRIRELMKNNEMMKNSEVIRNNEMVKTNEGMKINEAMKSNEAMKTNETMKTNEAMKTNETMNTKELIKASKPMKINRISKNILERKTYIEETYDRLEQERLDKIALLNEQIASYEATNNSKRTQKKASPSALLNQIVEQKKLSRKEIELLVDHIEVEVNGSFTVWLNHNFTEFFSNSIFLI